MRDKVQKPPHGGKAFLFGFGKKMRHTAFARVYIRAAERFIGNVDVAGCFYHFCAGYKKQADGFYGEHKVRDARRIYRPARAGTGDDGNLRNIAGSAHIIVENVAVSGQRVDAFLDARAAGIVDADQRAAGVYRSFDDVGDFLSVQKAERSALQRKILGIYGHLSAVDGPESGDDAVVGDVFSLHSEFRTVMPDAGINFRKRTGVEQRLNPFDGMQLAPFVLFFQPCLVFRIDFRF